MQTYEAWVVEKAPIFSRLPEVYRDNPVTGYLTIFWDELLISTKGKIDDIPRQLDPLTCDANWLDFLAPLCGFTGIYWNKNWLESHKRNLLSNSFTKIWNNKGSRECLSTVLRCFEIAHEIASKGDFIFGRSKLGEDALGNSSWQYIIYLKTIYKDTPVVSFVEKINTLFGPCWCKAEIKFDDSVVRDYLLVDDTQLFTYLML
ncbi:hypothetical protein NIES2100_34980 [Calothrix sp. NIES-2100]|uniref:phage tail protein n=1 Tax=Calothrix sp. NIES-2100 TaxID=1954172 RepID=UPI000B5F0436|nr:hypothetical protein NIES2100_34980 [Calothrix sp. NIES-2100]